MPLLAEYRSVLDYESTDDIVTALEQQQSIGKSKNPGSLLDSRKLSLPTPQSDWKLPTNDLGQFYYPNVKQEANRLQILRDYDILDSSKEDSFESLTEQAGDHYDVPWACVSLVDMGRTWYKSMWKDDIDIKEVPRSHSFCAYAIQSKKDMFMIRDTHQDPRFINNPYVTGHARWRFYAGVPLISPEGARLGTFCLLDRRPRPDGLSAENEAKLRAMAKQAMEQLVKRKPEEKRKPMRKRPSADSLQKLAVGAHLLATATPSDKAAPVEVRDMPIETSPAIHNISKKPRVVTQEEETKRQVLSLAAHGTISVAKPSLILPNPDTAGIDPDTYLAQLIHAMYGVELKRKSALELQGYFPKITKEQQAAYSMDVVSATRENMVDKLRSISQSRGRESMDCYNRFGEGLLNVACRRGYKDIVLFLLSPEVGLSARTRDDYGRTPLHDLCWNPSPLLEIGTLLMRSDPSLFLITDKRGYTPFQYARKSDWKVWRQFLYERRDLLEPLSHSSLAKHFS